MAEIQVLKRRRLYRSDPEVGAFVVALFFLSGMFFLALASDGLGGRWPPWWGIPASSTPAAIGWGLLKLRGTRWLRPREPNPKAESVDAETEARISALFERRTRHPRVDSVRRSE